MRYTHHRGLARVTNWVTLKFACMNLKKLATWGWNSSDFFGFFARFFNCRVNYAALVQLNAVFFDRLKSRLSGGISYVHIHFFCENTHSRCI